MVRQWDSLQQEFSVCADQRIPPFRSPFSKVLQHLRPFDSLVAGEAFPLVIICRRQIMFPLRFNALPVPNTSLTPCFLHSLPFNLCREASPTKEGQPMLHLVWCSHVSPELAKENVLSINEVSNKVLTFYLLPSNQYRRSFSNE